MTRPAAEQSAFSMYHTLWREFGSWNIRLLKRNKIFANGRNFPIFSSSCLWLLEADTRCKKNLHRHTSEVLLFGGYGQQKKAHFHCISANGNLAVVQGVLLVFIHALAWLFIDWQRDALHCLAPPSSATARDLFSLRCVYMRVQLQETGRVLLPARSLRAQVCHHLVHACLRHHVFYNSVFITFILCSLPPSASVVHNNFLFIPASRGR